MSKRVLLTGATGYLGCHLVEALLAANYGIVALKRKTSSLDRIRPFMSAMTLLDLGQNNLDMAFHNHGSIDAVIHVAANYGRRGEDLAQVVDANFNFPLRLLDAAASAGVPTFINTDTALDKYLNAYSLSKRQFAEWGKHLAAEHKQIRFINLKLEHFYGPADDETKFTAHVINGCLANAPELNLTLGEQRRDFIYIDDVVTAYLLLLEKASILAEDFAEFPVGSGEAVTVRHFVELAHRLAASTTQLNFGARPYRPGEAMLSQANIEPLAALGWRCRNSLEQGLKLTIDGQAAMRSALGDWRAAKGSFHGQR